MRIDYRPRSVVAAGILASIAVAASLSARASMDDTRANATTRVVDDAALADESSGDNWLAFGRTYSEQRFSPLTQVNDATIGRLAPDWVVRTALIIRDDQDLLGAAGVCHAPLDQSVKDEVTFRRRFRACVSRPARAA
jgi:glucose dehydrogenase